MTFCVKGARNLGYRRSGLVNVDFADVRAVMADAGSALMGLGWFWQKRGQEPRMPLFPHPTRVAIRPEALSLTYRGLDLA